MLLSVSLILMVGMFMGWLCQKCRLPSLLGMLATGMVLGPYVLNLLDGSILGIPGAAEDRPDYYSHPCRAGAGYFRAEKAGAACRSDVLCSGVF